MLEPQVVAPAVCKHGVVVYIFNLGILSSEDKEDQKFKVIQTCTQRQIRERRRMCSYSDSSLEK